MFAIFLRTAAIFLMIGCGVWLRRQRHIDNEFNRKLSFVLVNVFYPALIFSALIRNLSWTELRTFWLLPVSVFLIKVIGWLVGNVVSPMLKGTPTPTRSCFRFMMAVNNYSFLPIMIVATLWGERAVALIAFAALGAECFVWTLGLRTLTETRLSIKALKQLLNRPMFAITAALLVIWIRHRLGVATRLPAADGITAQIMGTLLETCHFVGAATIPVSAVVCGCRMAEIRPHHIWNPLIGVTLTLRLLVIPALAIAMLRLLPITGLPLNVLFVIAVQPTAMASVSLAELYDRDPAFAAVAVFVTHVVALLTIPLWLSLVVSS